MVVERVLGERLLDRRVAAEDARARAGELRLPLLAMHGTADTLTDPAGSEAFVAGAGSADKTLKT